MKFAILTFPGSGSDVDLYHAIHEVLGQEAEYVRHTESDLSDFDAVLIPSGASYGDYLRPGALALSTPVIESLKEFAASGKPVVGVGNGFQILTEAGLLPGAFLRNKGLKFRSGNTKLTVQNAETIFTSEYEQGQEISIPFAHEYGNYFVDEQTITELKNDQRIVFTYANDNVDGSTEAIAGVLNEQGNVLGMMPLPDRAVEEIIGGTDGLPLFNSIVKRWSEQNVSQA
ncbi:phosphoribosylformylglycinamidine synthase subunit PurQ [Sporosarcina sp. HYO08]|uniref:phosphoribosylformylglycinamidine synthase subunit PurQ n=1 Tax=Sporosarcina sp. HYO08 TaxID=1759557 RepID=UPI000799BF05|nr:phosphoribosylformylglycinamidine synthase subunit PurQ [Sporosarcina sp. HYO08]KXH86759.1 phosphoribosylformylglycinamidine synthase [Sporosarcina sp. HYO08]